MNARISVHEAGHCACGAALGSRITRLTIVPDTTFGGQCERAGPPSASFPEAGADSPPKTAAQIVELCRELAALPVPFGHCRVAESEGVVRMQTNIIELLAGREAERVFFSGLKPLDAEGDQVEAAALASAIAVTPRAVDALISYCASEARGIIQKNSDIVTALADALIANGTLDAHDITEIIDGTLAARP